MKTQPETMMGYVSHVRCFQLSAKEYVVFNFFFLKKNVTLDIYGTRASKQNSSFVWDLIRVNHVEVRGGLVVAFWRHIHVRSAARVRGPGISCRRVGLVQEGRC